MIRFWCGVLYLLCSTLALQAQSKVDVLNKLLSDPLLKSSQLGVAVFDLTSGQSLFQHNAQQLFRPASVQKVATAVTALSRLSADFSFSTELAYSGTIQNDTLYGSLYVIGGGNPLFSEADMEELIQAVSAHSIRYVTDSIVADVSRTDSLYWGPGWSWDDAPYSFQPALSSLMVNKGCVEITVYPGLVGEKPQVSCLPASSYLTINNVATTHSPHLGKLKVERNWSINGNLVTISGNASQTVKSQIPVPSSHEFFLSLFMQKLRSAGIEGGVGIISRLPAYNKEINRLITRSTPMKDVLDLTLKESDNLCAESLFFQLGTHYTDSCTTLWRDGKEAMNLFIKQVLGFSPDNYRIADGSGLSLYNYLSPQLLIEYLKHAYYNPAIFHPFYASLPIAGVDGTLHYRMKDSNAYRNVRAKTGSVNGVSTLAGYVKASNGHQLAFVIMNQGVLKLRDARLFQDRMCAALAQ
ncbi:MAG: D-alanyl-D-alanine carboxypeptidase/D-alanyl-D-alanine endopeptidase [Phocaeicola sp.]